ncbi:MAG: 1-(5-phosphoribosyl)-5-[(5-phosphoribosylamino)methylideneamino]imidazole-4-carboxamide isomerase [Acholeplasmatales bacterium]|nr:MAG: 1-(5-phosphoribosyl)-5-[(5-phosphoribosylamino)methylideneamino]imidazole-4-carboxamide isomerase [Acholeplasmatales bacterium]
MIIYPAIDLRGGRCVRLTQGDFNNQTTYEVDPTMMAEAFASAGAEWLHVIDLDGAADNGDNLRSVASIIGLTNLRVQLGGGIRTIEQIESLRALGAQRIIVGTMPIEEPDMFKEAIRRFAHFLAVAIDVRDDRVSIHGWQSESTWLIDDYVRHLEGLGVRTIIITDIGRDGMLKGPNLSLYLRMKRLTPMDIIASGGISTKQDVVSLRTLGVQGAIIGKALYEGHLALKAVL